MRIIFMGTPEFSAEFLRHLIKGEHQVIAVATQPDKPVGPWNGITFAARAELHCNYVHNTMP